MTRSRLNRRQDAGYSGRTYEKWVATSNRRCPCGRKPGARVRVLPTVSDGPDVLGLRLFPEPLRFPPGTTIGTHERASRAPGITMSTLRKRILETFC